MLFTVINSLSTFPQLTLSITSFFLLVFKKPGNQSSGNFNFLLIVQLKHGGTRVGNEVQVTTESVLSTIMLVSPGACKRQL